MQGRHLMPALIAAAVQLFPMKWIDSVLIYELRQRSINIQFSGGNLLSPSNYRIYR
jgi:hypothetical protein